MSSSTGGNRPWEDLSLYITWSYEYGALLLAVALTSITVFCTCLLQVQKRNQGEFQSIVGIIQQTLLLSIASQWSMNLVFISALQPSVQTEGSGETATYTILYDLFTLLLAALISSLGVLFSVLLLRQSILHRHEWKTYVYLLAGVFLLACSGVSTSIICIYSFAQTLDAKTSWNVGIIIGSMVYSTLVHSFLQVIVIILRALFPSQRASLVNIAVYSVLSGVAAIGEKRLTLLAATFTVADGNDDLAWTPCYLTASSIQLVAVVPALLMYIIFIVCQYHYQVMQNKENAKHRALTLAVLLHDSFGNRVLVSSLISLPSVIIDSSYSGAGPFDAKNRDFLNMFKTSCDWSKASHERMLELVSTRKKSTALDLYLKFVSAANTLATELQMKDLSELGLIFPTPVIMQDGGIMIISSRMIPIDQQFLFSQNGSYQWVSRRRVEDILYHTELGELEAAEARRKTIINSITSHSKNSNKQSNDENTTFIQVKSEKEGLQYEASDEHSFDQGEETSSSESDSENTDSECSDKESKERQSYSSSSKRTPHSRRATTTQLALTPTQAGRLPEKKDTGPERGKLSASSSNISAIYANNVVVPIHDPTASPPDAPFTFVGPRWLENVIAFNHCCSSVPPAGVYLGLLHCRVAANRVEIMVPKNKLHMIPMVPILDRRKMAPAPSALALSAASTTAPSGGKWASYDVLKNGGGKSTFVVSGSPSASNAVSSLSIKKQTIPHPMLRRMNSSSLIKTDDRLPIQRRTTITDEQWQWICSMSSAAESAVNANVSQTASELLQSPISDRRRWLLVNSAAIMQTEAEEETEEEQHGQQDQHHQPQAHSAIDVKATATPSQSTSASAADLTTFQSDFFLAAQSLSKKLGCADHLSPHNLHPELICANKQGTLSLVLMVESSFSTRFPAGYSAQKHVFIPVEVFEAVHRHTWHQDHKEERSDIAVSDSANVAASGAGSPCTKHTAEKGKQTNTSPLKSGALTRQNTNILSARTTQGSVRIQASDTTANSSPGSGADFSKTLPVQSILLHETPRRNSQLAPLAATKTGTTEDRNTGSSSDEQQHSSMAGFAFVSSLSPLSSSPLPPPYTSSNPVLRSGTQNSNKLWSIIRSHIDSEVKRPRMRSRERQETSSDATADADSPTIQIVDRSGWIRHVILFRQATEQLKRERQRLANVAGRGPVTQLAAESGSTADAPSPNVPLLVTQKTLMRAGQSHHSSKASADSAATMTGSSRLDDDEESDEEQDGETNAVFLPSMIRPHHRSSAPSMDMFSDVADGSADFTGQFPYSHIAGLFNNKTSLSRSKKGSASATHSGADSVSMLATLESAAIRSAAKAGTKGKRSVSGLPATVTEITNATATIIAASNPVPPRTGEKKLGRMILKHINKIRNVMMHAELSGSKDPATQEQHDINMIRATPSPVEDIEHEAPSGADSVIRRLNREPSFFQTIGDSLKRVRTKSQLSRAASHTEQQVNGTVKMRASMDRNNRFSRTQTQANLALQPSKHRSSKSIAATSANVFTLHRESRAQGVLANVRKGGQTMDSLPPHPEGLDLEAEQQSGPPAPSSSQPQAASLSDIKRSMLLSGLFKDRSHLFLMYPSSATGREIIDWLLSCHYARDREKAGMIAKALTLVGLHVTSVSNQRRSIVGTDDVSVEDDSRFYSFDHTSHPPLRERAATALIDLVSKKPGRSKTPSIADQEEQRSNDLSQVQTAEETTTERLQIAMKQTDTATGTHSTDSTERVNGTIPATSEAASPGITATATATIGVAIAVGRIDATNTATAADTIISPTSALSVVDGHTPAIGADEQRVVMFRTQFSSDRPLSVKSRVVHANGPAFILRRRVSQRHQHRNGTLNQRSSLVLCSALAVNELDTIEQQITEATNKQQQRKQARKERKKKMKLALAAQQQQQRQQQTIREPSLPSPSSSSSSIKVSSPFTAAASAVSTMFNRTASAFNIQPKQKQMTMKFSNTKQVYPPSMNLHTEEEQDMDTGADNDLEVIDKGKSESPKRKLNISTSSASSSQSNIHLISTPTNGMALAGKSATFFSSSPTHTHSNLQLSPRYQNQRYNLTVSTTTPSYKENNSTPI